MLGLCWRMLAPCWPMLAPCWAYVGDMLAILGLCWGYVRQFMLKKLARHFLTIFPSRKAKTLEKPTFFFDIAKMKFLAAEGPKTL